MYSRCVQQTKRKVHINKGYDCCRRQTDMARRYPDDDPLRRLSSHSVGLTVGLSVQRHHQHEIPARGKTSGESVMTGAFHGGGGVNKVTMMRWWHVRHLWSGFGLPFFLMLLAVVSLKWSRPTVTFVTCSEGKVTLWENTWQRHKYKRILLQPQTACGSTLFPSVHTGH